MVYHPTISGKTRIHSAKLFVTKKVSGQNYLILKKAALYRQNCHFGPIWVNKKTTSVLYGKFANYLYHLMGKILGIGFYSLFSIE